MESGITETDCFAIEDYMEDLNDWTRFTSIKVVFGFIYTVIFVMGFFGNIGLIFNIVRRKRANMVPNIFLVNLALSDLLLCIFGVPIAPVTVIKKRWLLGDFLCSAVPMIQGVTVIISSFGLVCIAIDRYRNISRMGSRPWSPGFAVFLTSATWALAVALNVPSSTFMALQTIPFDNSTFFCGHFCIENWERDSNWKKAFGTMMMSFQFVLPTLAMLFCYSGVWRKIKRDMLISAVAGEVQRVRAAKRRTKVLSVLVLMVAAFLLSWLPLSVINILRDFNVSLGPTFEAQPFLCQMLVHSLAMTSVFWNPLLYFWLSFGGRESRRGSRSTQQTHVVENHWQTQDRFNRQRFSQWGRGSPAHCEVRLEESRLLGLLHGPMSHKRRAALVAATNGRHSVPSPNPSDLNLAS